MASTGTPPEPQSQREHRQPHIVVVNDTQEILELFREILEEEGYRAVSYTHLTLPTILRV